MTEKSAKFQIPIRFIFKCVILPIIITSLCYPGNKANKPSNYGSNLILYNKI